MHKQNLDRWPEPFSPQSGLYLVATPIGNLRDITLRALDVLQAADVIYCEDKRVSAKLLKAFDIHRPLAVYNDHSDQSVRAQIKTHLSEGKIVALISDAGMPLISDPGYRLVKDMQEAGLPLFSIPGANAVLPALQLSGFATDQFVFGGFLPPKQKARQDVFRAYGTYQETLIFYESPKRLKDCLNDLAEVLSGREVAVARELTKKFEEVISGRVEEVLADIAARETVKGEIVLVLKGADKKAYDAAGLDALLKEALKSMSLKDAVKYAQTETGLPKSQIYDRALQLK